MSFEFRMPIENRHPSNDGFEVENAEHFHSVFRDRVLVSDDGDVPKRERFDKGFDDLVVRERMMSLRPFGRWHELQLFPAILLLPQCARS